MAKHVMSGLDALGEIMDSQELYGEIDCGG